MVCTSLHGKIFEAKLHNKNEARISWLDKFAFKLKFNDKKRKRSFSLKVPHNDYQSIVPQQSDVTNDTVTIKPDSSAGFLTEEEIT